MKKKQFPVYFDNKKEQEQFEKFAEARGLSLNSLIKQSLYAVKENPHVLNPSRDNTSTDILLNALEHSAKERTEHNKKFENSILNRLDTIESSLELIMKKAKVTKKEIKEKEGDVDFEKTLFSDP